jgi:hypothetical protein
MNYLNNFKDWIYSNIFKRKNDDKRDEEHDEEDEDGNLNFYVIIKF